MVSVPLSTTVGAYVRFRTQALPVPTEAQLKLPGPLQPAGSVAKVPVIANPEMALPSFEVNVILTVCVAPTATETALSDGVATIESLLPVGPPPPPGPVGAPPLVFPPLLGLPPDPKLLPLELNPHPDRRNSEQMPASNKLRFSIISLQ
jgi:hypothetical protein